LARAWKADGTHGRQRGWGLHTAPVHSKQELKLAEHNGAKILFVSPIFATQSHNGKSGMGRVRFGILVAGTKRPTIALGGMDCKRAQALSGFGIHGWAGIDALTVSAKIRT
jgi:thiamine-phosphate pyrophosphorylase